MNRALKLLTEITTAGSITLLAACGGGGSGGVSLATFSGTAAVGAPISNGTVTVIDATGSQVGTATTGTDGSYSLNFNPSNFTAPFVVKVTGSVGEAQETLVSVQPTATTSVVNITPITHAISATMSSTGNPLDLITNIAAERSNITATNITSAENGFRAALASNLNAVGLDSNNVNLMNTTFSSKLDKLLDNVRVEVTSNGQIKMSTSAGSAVDDLGNSAATPSAAQVVELPKGTIPSAANATALPAPTNPVGIDVLEEARLALNACFDVPAASRSTHAACTDLVTADYLNAGRNATQEFSNLLSDSGNDKMVFQKPEIIRQLSTTVGNEKLLVRLNAKRTDDQFRSITTVAENNHTGYTGWKLVGDQRLFDTVINGVAVKRNSINSPAYNRYETGFNIYINRPVQTGLTGTAASSAGTTSRSKIKQVVVTGPGLPVAGITLRPRSGCDFLAILKSSNNTLPYCASLYRLRSLLTDESAYIPTANLAYLYDSKTDSEIEAIKPLDLYKFVIDYYVNTTDNTTATVTYWNRLRSRPLTVAEMKQIRYVDFTDATKTLLTTASLWTGGSDLTLNWTVPDGTPSPFTVYFLHSGGSDNALVSPASRSAKIPCVGNSDCDGTAYINNMTTTDQYFFQTVSRNRFDTQIFTQITK